MTDRIVIDGMVFQGIHGVHEHEQRSRSRSRWTWSWRSTSSMRGSTDDLALTATTAGCSRSAARSSSRPGSELIEALAEAIAQEVLAGFPADEVTVRIRKPAVDLGGTFRSVGIEIQRRRPG